MMSSGDKKARCCSAIRSPVGLLSNFDLAKIILERGADPKDIMEHTWCGSKRALGGAGGHNGTEMEKPQ